MCGSQLKGRDLDILLRSLVLFSRVAGEVSEACSDGTFKKMSLMRMDWVGWAETGDKDSGQETRVAEHTGEHSSSTSL